jgi:hypothetical protein
MEPINGIANDLFYKIRSRFSGLKLGTESGEVTMIPEDARFFDFDYKDNDIVVGHLTISLAEDNSMKVYFSTNITESMDTGQKNNWYRFLKELRHFAKRRLLTFDTRDITKDNLDRRDYEFLTRNKQPEDNKESKVGESIMTESQMYGTKTTSFQKLMDTRLIVKHSRDLQDDYSPGARSRNISALFVENQEGERFKYPFIHLAGARAMQRHVANGGLPYDDLGKSIIKISEEIAQLKSFSNYVVRNDLMNSENNSIIERSKMTLENLRETISKLSKQNYYESYRENFSVQETPEVPEYVLNDYIDRFTVKNFNENIKSVFPIIYKIMKEADPVDYDDIVEMTTYNKENDSADLDLSEDEFENYENWVMNLGENSPLQTDQEQLQAIDNLNKLISQALPAGANGQNAILSLKGIIDDTEFHNQIRAEVQKTKDAMMDVRPMIQKWAEENASTVLDQLDFGDMEQPAGEEEPEVEPEVEPEQQTQPAAGQEEQPAAGDQTAAGQQPAAATGPETLTLSDDPSDRYPDRLNVNDLAEFIHSFYDRESGTFPKGPEGVCTMVGKKFGEQAESVARKFVERMAPQQITDHNPALQELSRMRELAGMSPNASVDEDYKQLMTRDDLKILRDAVDDNIIVSVAFVKKDGTVRHMAIKKTLGAYVPSSKEKTDRQANVEQNNDIKKVIDVNAYIKNLKEFKDQGMEENEAKAEAAKASWRSINLKNVLGFMVKNQFIDLRDENEIKSRFGDEVYNSLTSTMKSKLSQSQQEKTDLTLEASDYDDYDDEYEDQELDQRLADIKNPLKFDQDDGPIYRLIVSKFYQDEDDFDADHEFEMDGLGNIIDANTGDKFQSDELHYSQNTSVGVTSGMINAWLDKQGFDLDDIRSEVIDDLEYQRDPSGYHGVSNRDFFNPRESTELSRIRELAGMPDNDIEEAAPSAGKLQVFDIKNLDGGSGRGTAYLYDEQEKETLVSIEFDVDDQGAKITSIQDNDGNEIDPGSVEYDEDSLYSDILDFRDFQKDQDEGVWDEAGDRMRDDRLTGETFELEDIRRLSGMAKGLSM